MNKEVPIKIEAAEKIGPPQRNVLNLNQAATPDPRENRQSRKNRFWLIAALILAGAVIVLAGRLFWLGHQKNFSSYQELIPAQAKAILFLKIDQLDETAPVIWQKLGKDSFFWRWLKEKADWFFADTDLSWSENIAPLLEKEAVFMLLPSDDKAKLTWAILAETKSGLGQTKDQISDQAKQGLRRNFGTGQSFYRQIEINSVYSFNRPTLIYFYSQIGNLILIGNDLKTFQEIIDRIIDK